MCPKASYVLVNEQDQALAHRHPPCSTGIPKGIAEEGCQQGPAKGRLEGQMCDRGAHVASRATARASETGATRSSLRPGEILPTTPVFQTALGSDGA